MKKWFLFFTVLSIITCCDDGDVAVQDISFEQAVGASCGDLTYKIKGNEVLILNIPADKNVFKNDQTESNKPTIVPIADKVSVIYRAYNAAPVAANFCGAVPPATPIVIEEWTALSGTIEITSTVEKTLNATTNAEKITGYNHLVLLKNITFKKPNGEQFYEEFRFGNYKTSFSNLDFTLFTTDIFKCGTSNNLTSISTANTLISFDNTTNIINNTVTAPNNPKITQINATNNLYYRIFKTLDATGSQCTLTYAPSNNLLQEWKAISGTVEVNTASIGAAFIHTVKLKAVKFKKVNTVFYLGDEFVLGEIKTQ